ncbi:MAG TPA: 50S ribosomal protein L10 [bacterium]|nr:50S ribosomal protein L10 [bacterium]
MARKEKEVFVNELTDRLRTNNNFILTDYKGLNVEEMTDLRNRMNKIGCEFKVVKNTLARLAMKNLKLEKLIEYLRGPTAIAVEKTDIIVATKTLVDFSRQHQNLKIKGGFLEGHVILPQEVESLAKLPSKEVLLAQLCLSLQRPIVRFYGVLQGLGRNLIFLLDAIRKKKPEEVKEE